MGLHNVVQLLGGVALFLFAIRLVSESLQLLAGDRLRKLVGTFTRTPVLGVLMGALVTILIQSSSATTVMTISFVDAGLMTLRQAIGVVMGANIGTTMTGQLLAFKIDDLAFYFLVIGVCMSFFGRNKTCKYVGNGLFGLGLLFIGMQFMESAMSFMRTRQDILETFSSNPLMGVMAGALLTVLIQSSAATVGLTIALGMQGGLPLEAAVPIILGDNIGTTITAALAAIGTSRSAKQASAAHILFNIIGVCIFLPLMPLYLPAIEASSAEIGHQIANAHTLFNLCNTLLFLFFVTPFAAFIRLIVPDAVQKEVRITRYLDSRLIATTPIMAVEAVRKECSRMGFLVINMVDSVQALFFRDAVELQPEIRRSEEHIDALYMAIRSYAADITQAARLSDRSTRKLAIYVGMAADIERIGDQCKKMLSSYEARKKREHDFSDEAMKELEEMFFDAHRVLDLAMDSFINEDPQKAGAVDEGALQLRNTELKLRSQHITRLDLSKCDAEAGFIFVDILSLVEHIGYYSNQLAKATLRISNLQPIKPPKKGKSVVGGCQD
ncbi:MAG: Na/Pi cotransporter family protein [Desulfovibrionaceae bacterium]|nr:Na/Pi cotransporter family protein [Desulfovibrionaceae bacterium]